MSAEIHQCSDIIVLFIPIMGSLFKQSEGFARCRMRDCLVSDMFFSSHIFWFCSVFPCSCVSGGGGGGVMWSFVLLMCVSMLSHTMYSHLPNLLAAVVILAG